MNDSSINDSTLGHINECTDQDNVLSMIHLSAKILNILLGTPALVWCLWISLSEGLSGGLKPTQVFPLNLFTVELVFCVECLVEVIDYIVNSKNTMFRQLFYFLFIIAWTCRPLFQSCICVERYMAVVQPVAFNKYKLKRYRVGTSTLIWGLTIMYACSTIDYQRYTTITAYLLVSVCCLGVVIISLCCFFILRVLKQPGPGEVEGGRGGEKKQGTTDPQKTRAFRNILTNLVIIVVSSISLVAGYVVFPFTSSDFYCKLFVMFFICTIFSVMASPLLHLYREGRLHCRKGPETH
ncbi:hypothetical protein DPEC_G00184500 [Dallia pectoralis]|uniref:Uncharacterized protein n=1 Tax=Dallia pectoralis TaxID=75939 RepID=A0ACC2GBH0_DALPE|nr:hypothetical protein DPEC_G00184500 [Dallia pectoralis]